LEDVEEHLNHLHELSNKFFDNVMESPSVSYSFEDAQQDKEYLSKLLTELEQMCQQNYLSLISEHPQSATIQRVRDEKDAQVDSLAKDQERLRGKLERAKNIMMKH